ncbi:MULTISPECIES: SchA/CurD-like domain-containing protein [Streptomyces]|uniref:Quinol monooxygenase YgiN n=1 Tax=Streptomyces demainii TaxID=588122 RepID=A0ABT9L0Z6_9ACTN|nr:MULTISPECIES: SchA/CurD-like domain-containing protein [Streptomyces]MCO8306498.1 antibiotic biosynthesis monooxygenase [Streptomyces sp. RKCA744]MDP9614381.1 quinol monooxygenase YgiN [Streptomyces demainii]
MSTLSDVPEATADQSPTTVESALTDTRLRVVLLVQVNSGAEQRFLRAYDQMSQQVAKVPGHISDQLCQSIENPSQWLITSEWESAPPFLAWVDSPAHRDMVKPFHGCVQDTRSLRFGILRETLTAGSPPVDVTTRGVETALRFGDGLVRQALTFTVSPGSEDTVAKILADYPSPQARVDETTRLFRTSVFMSGNRVVRAVEAKGDLTAALRFVARQPEIRAVEEALDPYLEEDRNLDDPASAREFFARASLPVVHHMTAAGPRPTADVHRHALLYPVKTGCGPAVASLLARQDELAVNKEMAARQTARTLLSSTIFQRDDIVVRLVDLSVPLDRSPALAAGISGRRAAAVLGRLLDLGADGAVIDLSVDDGLRRFLADCDMTPITDRQAAGH